MNTTNCIMTPTEYFTEMEDEVFSDAFKKGYEEGFSSGVDKAKECLSVILNSVPFMNGFMQNNEFAKYIMNSMDLII